MILRISLCLRYANAFQEARSIKRAKQGRDKRGLQLLCLIFMMVNIGCGIIDDVYRIAISPDGNQIVFDYKDKLYLMNIENKQISIIKGATQGEEQAWGASFSPDGKKLVYVVYTRLSEGGEIYSFSLNEGIRMRLTNNALHDDMPSFSPDGSKVAFWRYHTFRSYSMGGYVWDDADIYILNLNGNSEKRITTQNYDYYALGPPYFSPDGREILYSAEEDTIFTVDSEGHSAPVVLLAGDDDRVYTDPYFSPDGEKIVFISDRSKEFRYEVWLMDKDGTNITKITHNQPSIKPCNKNPIFSPDGRKIFFLSDLKRDGKYSMWSIDVDGKNLQLITHFRKIVSGMRRR